MITRDEQQEILELFRTRLVHSGFGITLTEDTEGKCGKIGNMTLTLRFNNSKYGLICVTSELMNISSSVINDYKKRAARGITADQVAKEAKDAIKRAFSGGLVDNPPKSGRVKTSL